MARAAITPNMEIQHPSAASSSGWLGYLRTEGLRDESGVYRTCMVLGCLDAVDMDGEREVMSHIGFEPQPFSDELGTFTCKHAECRN